MENTASDLGKVHAKIIQESSSPLKRYQDVVIGSTELGFLLRYELAVTLLGSFPGAAGLWLRKLFYPGLMKRTGNGVVFGRDIVLRHPRKIEMGNNVIIDDGCVFDARGEVNDGIRIGSDVMMSRNVILGCKDGNINIDDGVGLGANTIIHAWPGGDVNVGKNVVIGANTYLSGGSHYHTERTDIPITQQGINPKGGITVADNVWLGASVTVLDGVTIGRDAIIGAGAVVTRDIPAFGVALGVPAKVIRHRA